MDRRRFLKKAGAGSLALASLPALGHALATPASAQAPADNVRWDIIHFLPVPGVAGSVLSPGGEAFAFAYFTPGIPSSAQIRLTGSGTFLAPAGGGPSESVTGGGTWQTSGPGLATGSGTYRVTRLVSWAFANSQFGDPGYVDNIGVNPERANGNAVLLIEYDDGSQGMLGIGCHGPGAPNGILEGVIATKGYVTYWNGELPPPDVDKNRTIFHLRRAADTGQPAAGLPAAGSAAAAALGALGR